MGVKDWGGVKVWGQGCGKGRGSRSLGQGQGYDRWSQSWSQCRGSMSGGQCLGEGVMVREMRVKVLGVGVRWSMGFSVGGGRL